MYANLAVTIIHFPGIVAAGCNGITCITNALPAGLSGVKVDCQAGVGVIGSSVGGGGAIALQYHSALEDSIANNFPGNHCINCMCHSTENLYRHAQSCMPAVCRRLVQLLMLLHLCSCECLRSAASSAALQACCSLHPLDAMQLHDIQLFLCPQHPHVPAVTPA